MSLNIKNEHVHHLAREAARRTGMTQTSAIEAALTRYLQALDAEQDLTGDRLQTLLRTIDDRLTDSDREAIRRDLAELHDDTGLPA
ncbi:type II toxin-antitoxin system VapB family antitoxin [Ornithinimicrobium cerasi]|uniref:Antitoxin VapB n=1 Tax=Ornithinimicrobium cerasi TaxID=2248773 RepID=A0A285VII9_9MICO|nr:type II toxin-antitoxin system VapB family antitoxin [Ornithinimicrobium cerasi]SOC53687.1 antitoxin VapB [Ornithinimicrobium cerasi]